MRHESVDTAKARLCMMSSSSSSSLSMTQNYLSLSLPPLTFITFFSNSTPFVSRVTCPTEERLDRQRQRDAEVPQGLRTLQTMLPDGVHGLERPMKRQCSRKLLKATTRLPSGDARFDRACSLRELTIMTRGIDQTKQNRVKAEGHGEESERKGCASERSCDKKEP